MKGAKKLHRECGDLVSGRSQNTENIKSLDSCFVSCDEVKLSVALSGHSVIVSAALRVYLEQKRKLICDSISVLCGFGTQHRSSNTPFLLFCHFLSVALKLCGEY